MSANRTEDALLFHYSAALDEIYRLRTALAYEAKVTEAHLSYATFPKSRRREGEDQAGRLMSAATGDAERAYAGISHLSLDHVRREAGIESLTRHQWEARELTDRERRYLQHLRNTEPA